MALELQRDNYVLSDDRQRMSVNFVEKMLRTSYWAKDRDRETIQATIEGSTCFGVWHGEDQVAFARVVSDYATFAWIADLIVAPEHRRRGLGHWIMDVILDHPCCSKTDRQILRTRDAGWLYEPRGFRPQEYLVRSDDEGFENQESQE